MSDETKELFVETGVNKSGYIKACIDTGQNFCELREIILAGIRALAIEEWERDEIEARGEHLLYILWEYFIDIGLNERKSWKAFKVSEIKRMEEDD